MPATKASKATPFCERLCAGMTSQRQGRPQMQTGRPPVAPLPSVPTGRTLLQAQRHEAQFAIGIGDQQQGRLAAVLLELVDALLQIGGGAHRMAYEYLMVKGNGKRDKVNFIKFQGGSLNRLG